MMENTPKVNLVSDTLSKLQWGKGLLFKKDWKKDTLDTKKILYVLIPVLILFLGFQMSDIGAAPTSNSKEQLSVSSPQNIEIPVAVEKPRVKESKAKEVSSLKYTAPQVVLRPRNLSAIPPGSLIKGKLISGGSNGSVKAEIREPLVVNGDVLIEGGTTILGMGASTEERLQVHFNQVIFKDGTFANISAEACDASDKIVGLKGTVLGNKALNIAGSIGLGFIGGMTAGLEDTQGQQGVLVRPPTMGNALLNATSTTALEQSRNLMANLKDKKPIIEVPSNTEICIIFTGGT
jgi:type IV secretory pathway VirB10-like protein